MQSCIQVDIHYGVTPMFNAHIEGNILTAPKVVLLVHRYNKYSLIIDFVRQPYRERCIAKYTNNPYKC